MSAAVPPALTAIAGESPLDKVNVGANAPDAEREPTCTNDDGTPDRCHTNTLDWSAATPTPAAEPSIVGPDTVTGAVHACAPLHHTTPAETITSNIHPIRRAMTQPSNGDGATVPARSRR